MIAGLVFQVASLVVFSVLAIEYGVRVLVSGMPIEKIEVIYIPSKNDLLIQLAGRF
jgi:hypothetical protein